MSLLTGGWRHRRSAGRRSWKDISTSRFRIVVRGYFRTVTVQVRRIYDEATDADGVRVLVDRVWPRGVRKADANFDEWLKDVAPSSELRTWFGHDPDRFDEFRRRYRDELDGSEHLDRLGGIAGRGTLTLLTATKQPDVSHAEVLRELLDG